ncbi:MAG: methylenetetrahydrofolate reductase [NAD(P)H] [Megasphaera micronuciformis]|nr:methylenetetrahydrofolate reductase [NAD(P)H] [Megasphaera micronuciformis]
MKIIDILKNKRVTLSFEVFPPKTADAVPTALAAAEAIAALHPDFMSVTYGAGGGTSDFTVHIASAVKKTYGVEVMPHLTCLSSTKEKVTETLQDYKEAGFETIMALRGDVPADGTKKNDFEHATDLMKQIKSFDSSMALGGACYPEGHPESPSLAADIENIRSKVDAGAQFLSTQMFFDNSLFYSYLNRLHAAGIDVPVLAGIMPITNKRILTRSLAMSGTAVPARYIAMVDAYGDSPEAMKQAGIAYATEQILDLYANGVRNVHVFAMNKPDVAKAISENIRPILDYLNSK